MAVKIRLQRVGRKKAPFYHIVIADERSPRDGKFIENIGTYNPTTIPATIQINSIKALDWLHKGAQPSDTVHRILSYKGILFQKHLRRGIKKGVLTEEQSAAKWIKWEDDHKNATLDAAKKAKPVRKKKQKKSEKAAEAAAAAPAAPEAAAPKE
jgi:small subunit ribosomal protein S16